MPEGPEVRRHADALAAALVGEKIAFVSARTRAARAWLAERPGLLLGKRVEQVRSRGKNLIGQIEGGFFFHSHLMMWGRWQVVAAEPVPDVDRRERARIATADRAAILLSAPIFELGTGDPFALVEPLRALGPDILPYPEEGFFDREEFLQRLLAEPSRERTIGAALLDQTVAAGIGNYLRAEILFDCRLDPWRRVADLSAPDRDALCRSIPALARRAYEGGGVTVPEPVRERMRRSDALVYRPGSEWGARHWVFRRSGLPCLVCGGPIRQKRQVTRHSDDGDLERIIYFCPVCQNTSVELKPFRSKRAREAFGAPTGEG